MDITIPDVGEGVTEATIVQWNAAPGDRVAAGQIILEIMTDKASMDVECTADGVLTEILHGADEEVPVGAVVGRMEPSGGTGGA